MPEALIECPYCRCPCSVGGPPGARVARCAGCGGEFSSTTGREIAGPGPDAASVPAPGPPPMTRPEGAALPEKIARFLMRERLGAGASGAVYRAFDPRLEREVALKVPHREVQQDPIARERFLREARAADRLSHPHIVPVYEAGSDGETSYLACALIPGRTLDDALDDGPFEPRRAARIVAALADAVHAAHREGIVHRDVKPANILLDADDRPRLADFGLARLGEGGARLTRAGLIMGTPAYLAPEQARGRAYEAAAPSDQYSLGATFYELLCGHVPFSGPIEIVVFHTLHTPPPPPRAEWPGIPAELEAICLKALAKRPADRYPSCRHLADDLRRWEAAQDAPVTALAPPPPTDPRPSPFARAPRAARLLLRREAAVAAITVAVVLAGSTAVQISRDDPSRRPATDHAVLAPAPPEVPADAARVETLPAIPARGAGDALPDLPPDVFAGPISPAARLALADPAAPTSGATGPDAPPAIRPTGAEPAPVAPEHVPTVRDLELRGGFLVLGDAEDDVSRGIPLLTRQRNAYQAAVRRGNGQEKDLAASREGRALLIERREVVRRAIDEHIRLARSALKSDAVVKKAYGDLQARLTELEAQIEALPTPEAIDRQFRRLKEGLEGQRTALAARVADVRAAVDRARRDYARLADDPGVAARIEEAGRASKGPIRLGPRPGSGQMPRSWSRSRSPWAGPMPGPSGRPGDADRTRRNSCEGHPGPAPRQVGSTPRSVGATVREIISRFSSFYVISSESRPGPPRSGALRPGAWFMPRISAECPGCARAYLAKETHIGRRVRCWRYGHRFILRPSPRPVGPATAAPAAAPPGSAMPAGPLPARIGRFIIDGLLGTGTFSSVYSAHDPTLDRKVSLKVTRREFQQDPKTIGRFLGMARRAASLTYPNIPPVYECGEEDGLCYVATALIAGRPLSGIVSDGPLDPRRAARIAAELAEALDHGHRQAIVHRDVKPANILLDADDRPYLLDFGLSRFAGCGERFTHLGTALGGVAYLAPEQLGVRCSEPGGAADQYSLGVILYELLCGRVPFSGSLEVVFPRTLWAPPPPLSRAYPGIAADLDAICMRARAKRPEDRYPSCRHLADDLRRWLAGQPAVAPRSPDRETAAWVEPMPRSSGSPIATIIEITRARRRIGPRPGPRSPKSMRAVVVPAACFLVAILALARGGGRHDPGGSRPGAPDAGPTILAVTGAPAIRPKPDEPPPRPESLPPPDLRVSSPSTPTRPDLAPPGKVAGEAASERPNPDAPGWGDPIELVSSAVPQPAQAVTFQDLEQVEGYFLLRAEDRVDGAVQRLSRARKALEEELSRRARDEDEWSKASELRSELTARNAELDLILRDYRQYVQQVEIRAAAIADQMLSDPFGTDEDNKGANWAGHITESARIRAFDSYLFNKLNGIYPGWGAHVAKMEADTMDLFRIRAQLARMTPEAIDKSRKASDRLIDSRRRILSQLAMTARGLADQTQKSYHLLAGDPEVREKIEEANRGRTLPARLGPSGHFRWNVRLLEETEALLTFRKKATGPPRSGRDAADDGRRDFAPGREAASQLRAAPRQESGL